MPRPNTSVRPPLVAGVRGRKLSDQLRAWRRQPRKRSPGLFWSLVALAAVSDATALALGARLLRSAGPPALPAPPDIPAGDVWLRLHLFVGLAAGAALAVAWGIAAVALVRLALAPPDGEVLRRLSAACLRAVAAGVALLVAVTTLGVVGAARPGWDAPALGTLFALPCCAALLFVRRAGWLRPPALLMAAGLAFAALVPAWHLAAGNSPDPWGYEVVLVNVSLVAHAALRYYFGRQRPFAA